MSFTLPNPQKNNFASGQILSFSHLNNNANNVIAMANYIGSANMVALVKNGAYTLSSSPGFATIPDWNITQAVGASGVIQVNSDGFTVLAAGTYIVLAHIGCIIPTGSFSNIGVVVDGTSIGLPSNKSEQSGNSGFTYINLSTVHHVAANTRFRLIVNNYSGGSGRIVAADSYFTIFRLK